MQQNWNLTVSTMFDDGLQTSTSEQQHALERKIAHIYQSLLDLDPSDRDDALYLLRDRHARYLHGGLGQLPSSFAALDASRPWICYWIVHGLALLDSPLPQNITCNDIVDFLSCCQSSRGGYGGGPDQRPHLAPSYAAVSALITVGGEDAYTSIDRQKLQEFLYRLAVPSDKGGGFAIHEGRSKGPPSYQQCIATALPTMPAA